MAVSTIDPNGLNIGQIGGRRNILINSDFKISQRGDYTSATAITGTSYFVDRWRTRISNTSTLAGTVTHSTRMIRIDCTTSGNGSLRIDQKIEIEDDVVFTNKDMVLSADIRSNSTDARIAVYHNGWEATNAAHSGGGSWERLSFTFNSGTLTTADEFSVQIGFDGVSSANVDINSGDYIEIKNVQLEYGDVATPFEHRSYGEELSACRRYYQRQFPLTGIGVTSGSSANRVKCPIAPTMRTSPSVNTSGAIRFYDGSATPLLSTITQVWSTPHVYEFDANCGSAFTATGRPAIPYNDTTSGNGTLSNGGIILDAEL